MQGDKAMLHAPASHDGFYATALNAMFEALHCNRASIVLKGDAGTAHFQSWHEPSKHDRDAPDVATSWKQNGCGLQPIRLCDINSAHLAEPPKSMVKPERIGALAFPLVSQGRLVGKLMTYFNEPQILTDDEIGRGITIARRVASIIDHNWNRETTHELQARLARELEAVAKLNEYSARLWQIQLLDAGLEEILTASIDLLGAEKGTVQFPDTERHVLVMKAQRGFKKDFLESLRDLSADHVSADARAWRTNQRIVIEDVEQDAPYAPFLQQAQATGYRAVISVPLIGKAGGPLAILSTYFSAPHKPSSQELRELDMYLHQAASFIERCGNEQSLRNLSQTLDLEVRAKTRQLEETTADLVRQSEQVHELSHKLLRVQDDERRHIARELHDSAGQTLAAIGLFLVRSIQEAENVAPALVTQLLELESLVKRLQKEIRTTSYLLHPPLLDEIGLFSALSWYVQGLSQRSELAVTLDMRKDFGRLTTEMELVIFRLVQECLTNIHRHSESKTAVIRIDRDSDNIQVEVTDKGRGISPERLAEIESGLPGVGIRGMKERLRQFCGVLNIKSDGSGTSILVTIPIPKVVSSTGIKTLRAAV
jgi:signal transduction histidine kinase